MGNSSDDKVETAALVISLVALIGTFLQVLQQYFASATGYANCRKSLTGGWLDTVSRKFRWSELRFEVQFQTPVIFVCQPDNEFGPVKNVEIRFLSGYKGSRWRAWLWKKDEREEPKVDELRQKMQKSKLKAWLWTPQAKVNRKLRQIQKWFREAWLNLKGKIWATTNAEKDLKGKQQSQQNRVHTADNEEATWLKLLGEIHKMEWHSRGWVKNYHKTSGLQASNTGWVKVQPKNSDHPPSPLPKANHTLIVALQPKPHSWDSMPAGIKKPYATTTVCHMIEIAAMMGIYWKEFDQSRDKYRAEGNGYMLTGSTVPDLGLCFTFQICGQARFQENRIIPVDGVKSFCFGYVPTLFQEKEDTRRLDAKDPHELQFGSMLEIAATMVQLQCNTSTANYFKTKEARHQHLFAVPFEIIGMLGKSLYMENSYYRMLPNPTPYVWDKNFFDLPKLIKEFGKKLDLKKPQSEKSHIAALKDHAKSVTKQLRGDKKDVIRREQRRERLIKKAKATQNDETPEGNDDTLKKKPQQVSSEETNDKGGATGWARALRSKERSRVTDEEQVSCAEAKVPDGGKQGEKTDSDDQELMEEDTDPEYGEDAKQSKRKRPAKHNYPPVLPGYYLPLLTSLHRAIETCDIYLKGCRRDLLDLVVREHIQEVLKMINEPTTEPPMDGGAKLHAARDETEEVAKRSEAEPATESAREPTIPPFFDELSAANPEDRQRTFMERYFNHVLPWVCDRAFKSLENRMRTKTIVKPKRASQQSLNVDCSDWEWSSEDEDEPVTISAAEPAPLSPQQAKEEAEEIWCTLIFRMLCWLQLHDFDNKDKQVEYAKSGLRGSRLPVFIS